MKELNVQETKMNQDLRTIFEAVKEATIVFAIFSDNERFVSAFKPEPQDQAISCFSN